LAPLCRLPGAHARVGRRPPFAPPATPFATLARGAGLLAATRLSPVRQVTHGIVGAGFSLRRLPQATACAYSALSYSQVLCMRAASAPFSTYRESNLTHSAHLQGPSASSCRRARLPIPSP